MSRGGLSWTLAQLSDRERGLLALLVGLALPVAVVALVLVPLAEARDRAAARASETAALLDWVSAQVRALPADPGETADTALPPAAPMAISAIEESLLNFALRDQVAQLANRADGGIDLALDDARFDLVAAWLDEMAPGWGYEIASFRIDAASPGLVDATLTLRPAG